MSKGWSQEEKNLAKRILEKARGRFEERILNEINQKKFKNVKELWMLEQLIREKRRDHDMMFQFSYDLLEETFAKYIQQNLIREDDLEGFRDERIQRIRMKV